MVQQTQQPPRLLIRTSTQCANHKEWRAPIHTKHPGACRQHTTHSATQLNMNNPAMLHMTHTTHTTAAAVAAAAAHGNLHRTGLGFKLSQLTFSATTLASMKPVMGQQCPLSHPGSRVCTRPGMHQSSSSLRDAAWVLFSSATARWKMKSANSDLSTVPLALVSMAAVDECRQQAVGGVEASVQSSRGHQTNQQPSTTAMPLLSLPVAAMPCQAGGCFAHVQQTRLAAHR